MQEFRRHREAEKAHLVKKEAEKKAKLSKEKEDTRAQEAHAAKLKQVSYVVNFVANEA